MNLEHLRWALEVERTGSITAAANQLFLAQSNLSNAIKALERDMGFTIFVRTSKGVVPTPEGQVFLDQSRASVQQLLSLRNTYEKKVFTISAHRHCTFVSDAVRRIQPELSENKYRLNIKNYGEREIIDSVFSGESLFGVVFYLGDRGNGFQDLLISKSLKEVQLGESPATILLAEDHPLLSRESVTIADLAEYPAIAFEENEAREFTFEAQMSYVGMSAPKGAICVGDRETLLSTVQHTQAVFITGRVWPEILEKYHLRCVSVGSFVRRFSIIRPIATTFPPFANRLLEAVTEAYHEMEHLSPLI